MSLAAKLCRVNVDGMLKLITYKQLVEWEVYNNLEPFTHRWDDYKIASIVQAIRNVLVTEKKDLSSLDDCLLQVDEGKKRPETLTERVAAVAQTVEEQIMIARIMAAIQAQLAKERSPDK